MHTTVLGVKKTNLLTCNVSSIEVKPGSKLEEYLRDLNPGTWIALDGGDFPSQQIEVEFDLMANLKELSQCQTSLLATVSNYK